MGKSDLVSTFDQKLDQVTQNLDNTLNQCLHDYSLDEMNDLYKIIEDDVSKNPAAKNTADRKQELQVNIK